MRYRQRESKVDPERDLYLHSASRLAPARSERALGAGVAFILVTIFLNLSGCARQDTQLPSQKWLSVVDEENLLQTEGKEKIAQECHLIKKKTDVEVTVLVTGPRLSERESERWEWTIIKRWWPKALRNFPKMNTSWVIVHLHLGEGSFYHTMWCMDLWYARLDQGYLPRIPKNQPEPALLETVRLIGRKIAARRQELAPQGRGNERVAIFLLRGLLALYVLWCLAFVGRIFDGWPKGFIALPLEWVVGHGAGFLLAKSIIRAWGLFECLTLFEYFFLSSGTLLLLFGIVVRICATARAVHIFGAFCGIALLTFIAWVRLLLGERVVFSYNEMLWLGVNPFRPILPAVLLFLFLIGLMFRLILNYFGDRSLGMFGNFADKVYRFETGMSFCIGKPRFKGSGKNVLQALAQSLAATSFANLYWLILLFNSACLFILYAISRSEYASRHPTAKRAVATSIALCRLTVSQYCRTLYSSLHTLRLAQECFTQGRLHEAMDSVQKAAHGFRQLGGRNPDVMRSRWAWECFSLQGEVYLQMGYPDQAADALQQGLRLCHGGSYRIEIETLQKLTRLYFDMGKLDRAIDAGQAALGILLDLRRRCSRDGRLMNTFEIMRELTQVRLRPFAAEETFALASAIEIHNLIHQSYREAAVRYELALVIESTASKMGRTSTDEELLNRARHYREETLALINSEKGLAGTDGQHPSAETSGRGQTQDELERLISEVEARPGDYRTCVRLGNEFYKQEMYSEAVEQYLKAIDVDPHQPWAFTCLGATYVQIGQFDAARQSYLRALHLAPNDARTRRNLARLYYQKLNMYDEAMSILQEGLKISPDDYCSCHVLGLVCQAKGDLESAREMFQAAIKLSPEYTPPRVSLARLLERQGLYREAVERYKEVLHLEGDSATAWSRIQALAKDGRLSLLELKRLEWGIFWRSIEEGAREGWRKGWEKEDKLFLDREGIATLAWIGRHEAARYITSDIHKAKSLAQQALERYNKVNRRSGISDCMCLLSQILAHEGNWHEAEELARKAADLADRSGNIGLRRQSHYWLGKVCEAREQWEEAFKEYQISVETIETVRERTYDFEARMGYVDDKAQVYAALVLLCLKLNRFDLALSYVERAKSRALIDLLGNRRINPRAGISPELLQQVESLRAQITRLHKEQRHLMDTPQGRRSPEVRFNTQQLRELQEQEIRTWEEIRRANPEYASLQSVEPLTCEEIQALLSEDMALIEYFIAEDMLIGFVVFPSEVHARRLDISRSELLELVDLVRSNVNAQRGTAGFAEMFRRLFSPLEELLHDREVTTLYFVPHGLLHLLPLHAAIEPTTGSRRCLLDRYRII